MPGVYWGIVAGVVALVATLLVCIELMYSYEKESPNAQGGMTDDSAQSAEQSEARGHRHAA